MATSTIPPFGAAAEQLRELNDRLIDAGRRVGVLSVDVYEKTVHGVTTAQQKLGEHANSDVVKTLVDAQVALTRDVAKAQAAAARQLLG